MSASMNDGIGLLQSYIRYHTLNMKEIARTLPRGGLHTTKRCLSICPTHSDCRGNIVESRHKRNKQVKNH